MKFVSPLRAQVALSLTLVLTLAAGPAMAESAKWNPVTWFNYAPSDQQIDQAWKKAEQAKKDAERASEEARKAQERADKAEAEARSAESSKATKTSETSKSDPEPLEESPAPIKTDTHPVVEAGASTAPGMIQTTPNFSELESSKNSTAGWNLMNLFKKEKKDEATAEQGASTDEVKASIPAADQPAAKAAESEGKGWHLNPFGKKEDKEESLLDTYNKPGALTNAAYALDPSLKTKAALIQTEKGDIAIELYPDEAPLTVANFVKLVDQGFYNNYNMKFHRVIPGFVIQTGDPTGTGAGGSKDRIPLEAKNKLTHNAKGVVAMARGGDPNSATSQFYITLAPQASLDGKYAIFGRVVSGLDVLDKINQGDMLYGVRLVDLKSITRDQPVEKKKMFSMF